MLRNNELINRSELLGTIIEKIEKSYAEDVSLLICYGSFVTGDYGEMSDIDFFFVPKTKRGYEMGYQFILNDIGYDLWPVSWERLKNISNLEEQPASILMDGKVLFASSEDDLCRLDELIKNCTQNLNNDLVTRKLSVKYIEKAKAIYFGLQNNARETYFVDAINIAETLLVAIAILNSTYVKKGLKRIENELDRLSRVPAGFRENHGKLIRTKNRADVRHILHEMIVETDELYKSRIDPEGKKVNPADLAGFYEEFKSAYNKLMLACDKKDYTAAYYAAFMIDRETQSFLARYTQPRAFPNMIPEVLKNDFEATRIKCLAHEGQLVDLLDKNGIGINSHQDIGMFRRHFMEKTT